MTRITAWSLVALCALGCDEHTAPAPAVSDETVAIYEAAIRGAVEEVGYAEGRPLVFIEWIIAWEPRADEPGGWQDPALLERLVAQFPGSCIDWDKCPEHHATGVITGLSEIHRIGPNVAEVGVDTYVPAPHYDGADHGIVTVRRDAGVWRMTDYLLAWVE